MGQQYQVIDDEKVDKDAVLFKNVYDLKDDCKDMSPIAVPKGFTQQFIDSPDIDKYKKILINSHKKLKK